MRFGDEKWGAGRFGTGGGRVSWNFTDFRDSFNQLEFAITERAFQNRVKEAFDLWESVLDIEFVQVAPSARADIQLGFAQSDGAGGTLGEAVTRFSGRRLERASIIIDIDEDWTTDADFTGNFRGDPDNFFAVFAHELGHAIGIDHLKDRNTLMHAFTSDVVTLTKKDVAAGGALYGPKEGEGAPGRQIMVGLGEGERLSGGAGRDSLFGRGGPDRLRGDEGDDRLEGGRGGDRLWGGVGKDRLDGGNGKDRLAGGRGADVREGGRGADEFVLKPRTGRDRVEDFEDGRDRIRVDGDLDVTVTPVGRGVEVRVEGGGRLILRDIDPDDIGPADFILI